MFSVIAKTLRRYRLRHFLAVSSACLTISVAAEASAVIVAAGFTFDDNAFVDAVLEANGNVTPFGAPTVEDALIGPALTGVAELGNNSGAGNVLVGFTDNLVFNGPGADLVLFEEGTPSVLENFRVALTVAGLGSGIDISVTDTGVNNSGGARIHAGLVDLSDLGVAPGATIDRIAITTSSSRIGGTDLAAAGALNSTVIPEPTTLAVWSVLGGIGIITYRRQRQRRGLR